MIPNFPFLILHLGCKAAILNILYLMLHILSQYFKVFPH